MSMVWVEVFWQEVCISGIVPRDSPKALTFTRHRHIYDIINNVPISQTEVRLAQPRQSVFQLG
jgi:hypothetical protein